MYYNITESGLRIRTLREAAGLTRQSFSEQIGVSVEALRKIENGNNGGKIDTLILIAEQFQVSLDYLVCGINRQTGQEDIFSGLKENEITFFEEDGREYESKLDLFAETGGVKRGVQLTPNGVQVAFDLCVGFLYLIQVPKGAVEV